MRDPKPQPVPLTYTVDAAGHPRVQQPPTLFVVPGDRIQFHRQNVPQGAKVAIIFDQPQFFSSETFDEGDGDIIVTGALSGRVTYQCGLKDAQGNKIPHSFSGPTSPGGDIEPDGGGPIG